MHIEDPQSSPMDKHYYHMSQKTLIDEAETNCSLPHGINFSLRKKHISALQNSLNN